MVQPAKAWTPTTPRRTGPVAASVRGRGQFSDDPGDHPARARVLDRVWGVRHPRAVCLSWAAARANAGRAGTFPLSDGGLPRLGVGLLDPRPRHHGADRPGGRFPDVGDELGRAAAIAAGRPDWRG